MAEAFSFDEEHPAPAAEPEVIPPRKRGRTRRDAGNPDPDLLHPENVTDEPATRTRKPSSRKSKADKIAQWAGDIKGAHDLASVMLQMPALQISDEQATALAGPAFETAEKYGWGGGVGPELRLLFVMATIYGPMAVQINMELLRRRAAAAKPAEAPPADPSYQPDPASNVYSFDGATMTMASTGNAGDGSF